MQPTSIRIPTQQRAALAREAALQGISAAELIRQAIVVRLLIGQVNRALDRGVDVPDVLTAILEHAERIATAEELSRE